MASTQKPVAFQVAKTNKTGAKVAVAAHRGTDVPSSTQRGHGYVVASSQQTTAVSMSPSLQRRTEAAFPTTSHSSSYYPRSLSLGSGPGLSTASAAKGTETQSRTEAPRQSSPHRKSQPSQMSAFHAINTHRNVSPVREEATRKSSENKPGREVSHRVSFPDAKSSRRLSFIDEKDSLHLQNLQEEDPPSKIQNPQGVRVPRRVSVHPKDEAVQTDPIPRTSTTSEVKSSTNPSNSEYNSNRVSADHRTVHRRIPGQESEAGPHSSVPSEPKPWTRNMKLATALKLSVLKDLDTGHQVPACSEPESLHKHSVYSETKPFSKVLMSETESNMKSQVRDSEGGRRVTISTAGQSAQRVTTRTVPEGPNKSLTNLEPSQKPSIHAELELTPRPLPPRSLPRYGPDCSWWALLNPEVEMPQSRPTTPDFELKSPPPLDPVLSFYEVDTNPFYEDLIFQREKASTPPSPKESPCQEALKEVPQDAKHINKQLIQGFNAFFLDVSEEMQNRIIWWLKGLCFSLLCVHCRELGLGGQNLLKSLPFDLGTYLMAAAQW
uniref:Uncharacterized protein C17orf47 homolog n=1 Tax=Castor canadensis TaxID=51338 RepID=A0A8B7VV89_CASCN|nr:uncharacterized protein C17orf47 homolog [Castor canadensis]